MKVTLEPPPEEEDTVVESTESDSDVGGPVADHLSKQSEPAADLLSKESEPAADHLFKQHRFADQIEQQRKLLPAKVRRGTTVMLNQKSLGVKKIAQEESDNIRQGPKLSEKRKTRQKSEKLEKAQQNNSKTSPPGTKRHPVQNDQLESRKETRERSSIDDSCDLVAAEEVKRILEELESIKQRISQIEHDILNKIVW